MALKIEPCPFCGETPEFYKNQRSVGGTVWCVNEECMFQYEKLPLVNWNKRPQIKETKLKSDNNDMNAISLINEVAPFLPVRAIPIDLQNRIQEFAKQHHV